ncbi:MAG TPA: hypothetical protein VEV82_02965 [Actinomycetota bacterium]|nr:hypothetical protein [Actinomycetota bacterium]
MIAAVAVLGLLATGCFTLRGFYWKIARIKVGDRGALFLQLRPLGNENNSDRVFVLVGLLKAGAPASLKVVGRKFDIKGEFGNPRKLIKDNVLRDFLLGDSFCETWAATDSSDMKWFAYRTKNPVTDQGKPAKTALTKITFEGVSVSSETGNQFISIGVGGWNDDGDDIPETKEVTCNSGAHTNIRVAGGG